MFPLLSNFPSRYWPELHQTTGEGGVLQPKECQAGTVLQRNMDAVLYIPLSPGAHSVFMTDPLID